MWEDFIAVFVLVFALPCSVLSDDPVLIGPKNQYILENQNLTFECKVNVLNAGDDLMVINNYGFPFKDSDVVRRNEGAFTVASVTIKSIPVKFHKKKIECEYGSSVHQFTVHVYQESELPVIYESKEVEKISSKLGREFALNCTETNLGKIGKTPVFVWSVGSSCFLKEETPDGGTTSIFKVDKVTWSDGGIYTCTVLNPTYKTVPILQDQKHYQVNVSLEEPEEAKKEEEVIAVEGKEAKLRCEIAGSPIDIVWEKENKVVAEHKAVFNISELPAGCTEPLGDKYLLSQDGKTLTILKLESSDRGKYKCIGRTEKKSIEHTFTLRVRDPLGALWPFLGILLEAIVLAFIIILSEMLRKKKENNNQKAEFSVTSSDGGSKEEKVRLSNN